jgi:hypothetical protein
MFEIGRAVIEDDVGRAPFCCDLEQCKGACCYIAGGRGAPLEDDEVLEIQKAYPIVRHSLSESSIKTIETSGLVDGVQGDFATTCVDLRECVFVVFEEGVARCSFELAYEQGLLDWRKPISCHLFPIRIRTFGQDFLRYEEIPECEPGRERGNKGNVSLREFLKEPLVRKYGQAWYDRFIAHCNGKAGLSQQKS